MRHVIPTVVRVTQNLRVDVQAGVFDCACFRCERRAWFDYIAAPLAGTIKA